MALNTQGVQEIRTDLANTQVVNNPGSTGPAIASALVNTGATLYTEYVKSDANKRSVAVNEKLSQDLQDIEDGTKAGAEASAEVGTAISQQIADLAANDPRLAAYAESLGTLDTAVKQRKGARALHALRAESALKETLAKAPGLRKEVTAIAARNLGFDPTSATISMILKGIDSEKEPNAVSDDWLRTKLVGELQKFGVAITPQEALVGDLGVLQGKLDQVQGYQGNIDRLTSEINQGRLSLEDGLADYTNSFTGMLSTQVEDLVNSSMNIGLSLKTEEEYLAWRTELIPQLRALQVSMRNNTINSFSAINASPEQRKLLDAAANSAIERFNTMTDGLINSDDVTKFQARAKTLQVFKDNLGMDALQSFPIAMQLEAISPGIGSTLGAHALTKNPATYDQLISVFTGELSSLATEDPKRRNLQNSIEVLKNYRAFSMLPEEDHAAAAKNMGAWLEGYVKIYEEQPELLTNYDFKATANSVAGLMQMSEQFSTSDWAKIAEQGATPAYQHMISELEKGDDDSKIMAGILSDSYNRAAMNHIKKQLKGELKDLDLTINLETGEVKNFSKPPAGYSEDNRPSLTRIAKVAWHGDPHAFERRARIQTERLQGFIDTIYDKRHLDPSLKDLDKGQIATILTRSLRGEKAVTFSGTPTPFETNSTERARRRSVADAIDASKDAMENLMVNIQSGALGQITGGEIDNLSALTARNQELQRQLTEAEKQLAAMRGKQ